MNYDSFRDTDNQHPNNHLSSVKTAFGVRSFYSSVSFCNRCGCCAQDCPTYLFSQEETLSPRGRNQAARLLVERKLSPRKNKKELLRLINSCTLCGRCTQHCAGQIPTTHHVLEMRRLVGTHVLPFTLQKLLEMRFSYPRVFDFLLRFGLLLRKGWFIKLANYSGLAALTGFGWLHQADGLLPSKIGTKGKNKTEENPSLIYIPSLETFYFQPSVYQKTLQSISQKFRPAVWPNTPTGRFEYVFGSIRKARVQLKDLIARHRQLPTKNIPVLTDSIDTYVFLKGIVPSLFEDYPAWQKKAEQFAGCVHFITDFLQPNFLPAEKPVYLASGTLFSPAEKPTEDAKKFLRSYFSENFVQFTYETDMPAFAYSFVKGNMFSQLLPSVLQPVKEKQIKTIITLSGWSKMEWERALKQNHINAQVFHLSELNR